jgi:osmotically-inducible protein OsmY
MKTDEKLLEDVVAELNWDIAVRSKAIRVSVTDGTVALTGDVGSLEEKMYAERAARRVSGVREVSESLTVVLDDFARQSDPELASAAKQVLSWTSSLCTNAIDVSALDGQITLSGNVGWQYQKRAAEENVGRLRGVIRVQNNIAVHPIDSSATIKSEVEAAVRRSSRPDHQNIAVEVKDGEVTLSGSVYTISERDAAVHSAWNALGVRNVINGIVVAY